MNIFDAVHNKDIAKVKLLLAHPNIDVNAKNIAGWTPLHTSCSNNRIKIAELLLAHPNIDVNAKNEYGWTPLHKACQNNNIELVKLLLAHPKIKMNLNYKNYKNIKIRNLLKSHTNLYENSMNKILDSIED